MKNRHFAIETTSTNRRISPAWKKDDPMWNKSTDYGEVMRFCYPLAVFVMYQWLRVVTTPQDNRKRIKRRTFPHHWNPELLYHSVFPSGLLLKWLQCLCDTPVSETWIGRSTLWVASNLKTKCGWTDLHGAKESTPIIQLEFVCGLLNRRGQWLQFQHIEAVGPSCSVTDIYCNLQHLQWMIIQESFEINQNRYMRSSGQRY